jgi:mono/diheme cytochrome c family protein
MRDLFCLILPWSFLGSVCVSSTVWAQVQNVDVDTNQQAWARQPKEIVFQNDSQWEDNRWQQSDVGPFLAGAISTPKGMTLKGLAIRVGDAQQATLCFDTARLQCSAAWEGGFLEFDARRFGLTGRLKYQGQPVFHCEPLAGWAYAGRFQPNPDELTLPEVEAGYTPPGTSVTRLPKAWAAYRGLYTSGQRVVLNYTVGSVQVLESPWFIQSGEQAAVVRSLDIGPSTEPLQMWVGVESSQVALLGDSRASLKVINGLTTVAVAPHEDRVRYKVLISAQPLHEAAVVALREAAADIEDLTALIQQDIPRWPEVLRTEGTTTEEGGPYVIDSLTLPFDNPYKALLFTSGHDFFSDGSAAICTVHGDVWQVHGIDRDLRQLRWRRFATGLFQPLGLKIVGDQVYVLGRDQITRLHDRNGDGEADHYENFNNDLFITPRTHDFVTCLDTDPQGNFYFIHAKTGVMRVSADGSASVSLADGFRNPNGMAVSPSGLITAAPQQGTWTPESSLIVVEEDGYYGFGGPRITSQRPLGWDLPMCFIPRAMDNSGGGQVWVEGDRWGPLSGQMLHLSYGQCRILLALTEQVDGKYQGGTLNLPTTPTDFESGIMRGRFSPHDGQLYVSGLRGWQSRAIRDGCFQRVRFTGGPVPLPIRVETLSNGVLLKFAEPLDREMAEDPDNYFVEQWNYRWTEQYGSPDFSVADPDRQGRDTVDIVSATVLEQEQAVFLEMAAVQPVHQMQFHWLLSTKQGEKFQGSYAHTINRVPDKMMPGNQLTRHPKVQIVSAEEAERLRPGIEQRFEAVGDGTVDVRTVRLITLRQNLDQPPTPFMPAGPFHVRFQGTLRVPQSGFYDFRLEGAEVSQLWINETALISSGPNNRGAQQVLLRKGHNRVRVELSATTTEEAKLQLYWKGHNFSWEPVPPEVLFHDSGSEELQIAQQRRYGRDLFGSHHCANCHQIPEGPFAMFELSLEAPDLSRAGARLRETWLTQWLAAPTSLEPQTCMPAMLGDGAAALQQAADLAAFLTENDAPPSSPSSPSLSVAESSAQDGERLYEVLGCIACHRFNPATELDVQGRHSLYLARAKYSARGLSGYIKNPTAHHATTAMPDFQLTDAEAAALTAFIQRESLGQVAHSGLIGDGLRGRELFGTRGCRQCHTAGEDWPTRAPAVKLQTLRGSSRLQGCLASSPVSSSDTSAVVPNYQFTAEQQRALARFLRDDLDSLRMSDATETAHRLMERLRCASCHDRDGQRSLRPEVVVAEGSGLFPEVLPSLTWAGEKFRPEWTEALLHGTLPYKSRPWIAARMPAWPHYGKVLAAGLAAQHSVASRETPDSTSDASKIRIGEQLTLPSGLDCRQCHAIGELQPRGDKDTQINLGINFSYIRERMRPEAYQRFMLDPPRYDPNTKMIRLSENGRTTKLKELFDADAHQQFEAVWHYIQSLPASPRR